MRDAVIVGAGVSGAMVAHELLEGSPQLDVELIDKDERCAGASAYAGAIDSPYSWSSEHARLQRESWRWHERVADSVSVVTYRRPLLLHWLGRAHDREQLRDVVRAPVRVAAALDGYDATLSLTSKAYTIDPLGMIAALTAKAARRGLTLSLGRRVLALEARDGHVGCHLDDGTTRVARHVVLSVGPWIKELSVERFALRRDDEPRVKRVYGLRIAAFGEVARDRGWADPDRGLFLFPRVADDAWAMSVRHAVWDVDPDVPQPPDPALVQRAARLLDAVFGASRWELRSAPTLADTYTQNRRPLVEQVADGLATVITGTHGSGVRLAPALAGRAVELVRRSLSSHHPTGSASAV